MATSSFSTNPLLPVGSWVQLNMQPYQNQPANTPHPTAMEQTIGIIRSAYVAQGQQFYQIVWNPRGIHPETGMYTVDQLTPITNQQAQDYQSEVMSGTYPVQQGGSTVNI